jgi:hypothetical protein
MRSVRLALVRQIYRMPSEKTSILHELRGSLIDSSGFIRAADLHAALRSGLIRAACFSMLMMVLLFVLHRFIQVPASGALKLLSFIILASAFVLFLRTAWRILLHGVSLEETADWLDAATNKHNRVVAALELCEAGDDSPFAIEAIRDGVSEARGITFFESPDSRATSRILVPLLVITVTVAVIAAMPSGELSRIAAANSGVERVVADQAVLADLTEDPSYLKTSSTQSADQRAHVPGETNSAHPQLADARSASGLFGGASDWSRAGLSQIRRSQPDARARSGRSNENSAERPALQNPNASDLSGTPQSSPGIGSPTDDSQTTPDQQAAEKHSASDAQAPGFNQEAEKDPSESSGSAPPAGEAQQQSAGDLPDSQKPDSLENSPSAATPVHKPASGSDKANNRGQDTGIDAPKKSRGVAPLLLETRLADLFQGRPLSGPEQRSLFSVKPEAGEDAGATRSDMEARGGDEQAVSRYEVPADLRQQVGDYFKHYEQDAELDHADAAPNKE